MPSRPLALVIDDTDAVRQLYVSALRLEGFTVEEAHDGQQGLEKAVALRPDIIISDVAMPVMDGRETIRRLREDDRTRTSRSSCAARTRVARICWRTPCSRSPSRSTIF